MLLTKKKTPKLSISHITRPIPPPQLYQILLIQARPSSGAHTFPRAPSQVFSPLFRSLGSVSGSKCLPNPSPAPKLLKGRARSDLPLIWTPSFHQAPSPHSKCSINTFWVNLTLKGQCGHPQPNGRAVLGGVSSPDPTVPLSSAFCLAVGVKKRQPGEP